MNPGPAAMVAVSCSEAPATHKGGRGLTSKTTTTRGAGTLPDRAQEAETTMDNLKPWEGAFGADQHRNDSHPYLAIGA